MTCSCSPSCAGTRSFTASLATLRKATSTDRTRPSVAPSSSSYCEAAMSKRLTAEREAEIRRADSLSTCTGRDDAPRHRRLLLAEIDALRSERDQAAERERAAVVAYLRSDGWDSSL